MPYGYGGESGRYSGYTPGGGDEYDIAYNRAQAPKFNYTPDPNDPELALLRTRALRSGQLQREDTLNEVARAGLLGSSAGMRVVGGVDDSINRNLEGIDESVFARRRQEAHGDYQGDVDFRQRLQMLRLQALIQQQQQDQNSGLFGDLGELVGTGLSFLPVPGANQLGSQFGGGRKF